MKWQSYYPHCNLKKVVHTNPVKSGPSSQKSTIALSDTQTAKNNGTIAEDFNIQTTNATGGTQWTIGSSPGMNTFVHEFSTNSGSTWTKFSAANMYQTLATNISANASTDFDLRITVPSSTSDYVQKSITVTIQAVAH
jgi:hypothetical protein